MRSRCPECGNIVEVPPKSSGKMGRCVSCQSLFRIQPDGSLRTPGKAISRESMLSIDNLSVGSTGKRTLVVTIAGVGLVTLVAVFSLWLFTVGGSSRDHEEAKHLQDLKEELRDRDAEIERLENETRDAQRLRRQLSMLESKLEDANASLAMARNQIRDREEKLAALGTELQSVKERLAETKKQHNAEADSLRKALSSVNSPFRNGGLAFVSHAAALLGFGQEDCG